MTDSEKELVAYIRAQTEWCSRKLSGGDWFAIDPDVAPFRAADAIERLVRERDEARMETKTANTLLEAEKWARANVKAMAVNDLEAEVARLREAGRELLRDWDDPNSIVTDKAMDKLRKALEAKHD